MSVFMLSLIGLPLTGGFIGKLQIFQAALEEGWVWLTIIGLLNSALSVYYYMRVVVYLYMREGSVPDGAVSETTESPGFALTGLVGAASAVVYLGVFPQTLLELAASSVSTLF
jgi:NADH-quinone oxidoreductase subunit N